MITKILRSSATFPTFSFDNFVDFRLSDCGKIHIFELSFALWTERAPTLFYRPTNGAVESAFHPRNNTQKVEEVSAVSEGIDTHFEADGAMYFFVHSDSFARHGDGGGGELLFRRNRFEV
jgi:hypothetical protein